MFRLSSSLGWVAVEVEDRNNEATDVINLTHSLGPGTDRGGDGTLQVVEITAQLQVVILELRLEKPASYKPYLVRITSAENPNPMSLTGLALEDDRSTLKVPITAEKLRGGDYDLTVIGEDDNRNPVTIDIYSFRSKRTG